MTIIGAITSNKNKMYYRICDKTNLYSVDKFFRKLHQEINLQDKVIVMDNHAAHHSKFITEFIEEREGILLFMPPTSSYFNPIETIWSWVK